MEHRATIEYLPNGNGRAICGCGWTGKERRVTEILIADCEAHDRDERRRAEQQAAAGGPVR